MVLLMGQPNNSRLYIYSKFQGLLLQPTLCLDDSGALPQSASESRPHAGVVCELHLSISLPGPGERLKFAAELRACVMIFFCSIYSLAKARSRVASNTKLVHIFPAD